MRNDKHVTGRTASRNANLKHVSLLSKAKHALEVAQLKRKMREKKVFSISPQTRKAAKQLLSKINEFDNKLEQEVRDKVMSLPTRYDLSSSVRKLAKTMTKRSGGRRTQRLR
jgi:hypothetical protein